MSQPSGEFFFSLTECNFYLFSVKIVSRFTFHMAPIGLKVKDSTFTPFTRYRSIVVFIFFSAVYVFSSVYNILTPFQYKKLSLLDRFKQFTAEKYSCFKTKWIGYETLLGYETKHSRFQLQNQVWQVEELDSLQSTSLMSLFLKTADQLRNKPVWGIRNKHKKAKRNKKKRKRPSSFGSVSTQQNAIGDDCFGCRILPRSRCWHHAPKRHRVILTAKMR